LVKS